MKKKITVIAALAVIAIVTVVVFAACGTEGGSTTRGQTQAVVNAEGESEIVIRNEITLVMNVTLKDGGGKTFKSSAIQPGTEESFTVPNGSWTVDYRTTQMITEKPQIRIGALENTRVIFRYARDERSGNKITEVLRESSANRSDRLANAKQTMTDLDKELSGKVKAQANTAFFPLTLKGMDADTGSLYFDAMSIELVNTGNYSVIEKQKIEAILAEHDFQMSGAVGYKTIGQLLEADVVIFGTAGRDKTELLAVDVAKFAPLAAVNAEGGAQKTLILPVTGVPPVEAGAIAAFMTMAQGLSAVDQSASTTPAPLRNRPWGTGIDGRKQVADLIAQHNADSAVGINIVRYANAKLATIRVFDKDGSVVKNGITDIQYTDPFEFWVKLQQPGVTTRRAEGGSVWVIYWPGVNRGEAEEMMALLFADLVSMGSQGLGFLDDRTADFEYALSQIQGKIESYKLSDGTVTAPNRDWMGLLTRQFQEYKNNKIEPQDYDPYYKLGWIATGARAVLFQHYPEERKSGSSSTTLIFDVSSQGGRTRIEAIRPTTEASGSFICDYGSAQEFRRSLRAHSLRLVSTLYRPSLEYARKDSRSASWVTGNTLTGLRDNVPVPDSFVKITRAASVKGQVPQGGFYMGKNMVTQREYEALMGSNPSTTKGATLPVHNVNILDAMEYCNRLSIRDGLLPAYDFFYWQGIPKEETVRLSSGPKTHIRYRGTDVTVRWNRNANGYRLPTPAEWHFALHGGTPGAFGNFVKGFGTSITDYGWFNSNSGGKPQPVGQKEPFNGLYDMLGNAAEYIFDGFDLSKRDGGVDITRETVLYSMGRAAITIGGDYQNNPGYGTSEFYVTEGSREWQILGPVPGGKPNDLQLINRSMTAGFRIVRPIFDYWKYVSGE